MKTDKGSESGTAAGRIHLAKVEKDNKAAYQLFMTLAQFSDQSVSADTITSHPHVLPQPLRAAIKRSAFDEIVTKLASFSLIRLGSESQLLTDPMFSEVARSAGEPRKSHPIRWLAGRRHDWESIAIQIMLSTVPSASGSEGTQTWTAILPHAQSILDRNRKPTELVAELAHSVGEHLHSRGAYAEAKVRFDQLGELYDSMSQQYTERAADALFHRASVRADLGEHVEACEIQEEAVRVRTRISGAEDSRTYKAVGSLAIMLAQAGRLEEAESRLNSALDASEKALRDEPAAILAMANGLAFTLYRNGQIPEAVRIGERVLTHSRSIQGATAKDTLMAMNNLAVFLRAAGEFKRATQIARDAHKLLLEGFGEDHPDTLTALGNWGLCLGSQGEHARAREVFEREVSLRMRTLGPSHPATIDAQNNLDSLSRQQRRQRKRG